MSKANINSNKIFVKTSSLKRSLVIWFSLLSLIPLIIISFFSYQQANQSLRHSAEQRLSQSAKLSRIFIENWFDYRFMDADIQAHAKSNTKLLMDLSDGWPRKKVSLAEFVKSYAWAKQVDVAQEDLINLIRGYDYINNVFLIDNDGNIFYSVPLNLTWELIYLMVYGSTRFAKTARESIHTGKTLFSGIERYAPSNHILAGFIVSLRELSSTSTF